MEASTQFCLRMEPELIRKVDEEAEKTYKTRTEFIKEALLKLLEERNEKERLKKLAAELWLKGEISESKLKKVLTEEEIKDIKFGKHWIEEAIHEIGS
ncbi:MAG: ribbon-helix-helix protein, CopG family [Candidatus Aenigmarchaeota archaeon]|nr:ribbon-helix-helix protein, CopG family [Candidatus Aenigmarchaeota archaeon]